MRRLYPTFCDTEDGQSQSPDRQIAALNAVGVAMIIRETVSRDLLSYITI